LAKFPLERISYSEVPQIGNAAPGALTGIWADFAIGATLERRRRHRVDQY
jgi:hypothetical protein